jgi:hypothetical protein
MFDQFLWFINPSESPDGDEQIIETPSDESEEDNKEWITETPSDEEIQGTGTRRDFRDES